MASTEHKTRIKDHLTLKNFGSPKLMAIARNSTKIYC